MAVEKVCAESISVKTRSWLETNKEGGKGVVSVNDDIYIEKLIENPRHIEIQILCG